MFVNFGEKEEIYCLNLISEIRKSGINAEIYPDNAKMKKQMSYANNKNIAFVALVGENEINEKVITLKNMKSGEQDRISLEKLIENLMPI